MVFKFFKNEKQKSEAGMTFIEIIVVMGIFAAISATVLFNYRDFSSGVKLQNLSQEIALQGKRAQTLASQGRKPILSDAQQSEVITNNNFLPLEGWVSSYGLAFDVANHPTSFIFYFNSPEYYIDANNDSEYTLEERNVSFNDFVDGSYTGCGQATSECVEEIMITDGSVIDLVCINAQPAGDFAEPNCDGTTGGSITNNLYISFTRPFLESTILDENLGSVSHAFIRISSADGTEKRYVTFWKTGQISVN